MGEIGEQKASKMKKLKKMVTYRLPHLDKVFNASNSVFRTSMGKSASCVKKNGQNSASFRTSL